MFIKYNGTNVHALPLVTFKDVRIRNKRTGKVRVVQKVDNQQSPREVFSFKPGWNLFPNHVWEQNVNTPSIQKMIKKKTIEFMAHKVTVNQRTSSGKLKKVERVIGQDDKPVKLKYFGELDAVKIVKSTWNRDMLQEWLEEETRYRVKKVISKQVEPLLANTTKEDEDDFADLDT